MLTDDPIAGAIADALAEILPASVDVAFTPAGQPPPAPPGTPGTRCDTAVRPSGRQVTYTVRLNDRMTRLVTAREGSTLAELLEVLPAAGADVAARLPERPTDGAAAPLPPPMRRALRDMVAAEVIARYAGARLRRPVAPELMADTIEFLLELSSTRVESHALTHGVLITNVLQHQPRLEFAYPADIRAAKRAPLLFDGRRSVLIVDPDGRARTELQRHRLHRLSEGIAGRADDQDLVESGSLVAEATSAVGGLGFFLRGDRSIWIFVDGLPLLVRRSEYWTAFPLELTAAIENMIGGGAVAELVARTAFLISALPEGAILAIVDDPAALQGVVPAKDRYDERDQIGLRAMRPETRLHHLIDAHPLDADTLVRLASLDGATVVDRDGRLLAYGAVVTSIDSEHEGARTAAAKTLSRHARVVLKVSVDGDITIFRDGVAVTTLLGRSTADGVPARPAG